MHALSTLMKCEPPVKVKGRGISFATIIYLKSIVICHLRVFKDAGNGEIREKGTGFAHMVTIKFRRGISFATLVPFVLLGWHVSTRCSRFVGKGGT